jgi:hypothetical protein
VFLEDRMFGGGEFFHERSVTRTAMIIQHMEEALAIAEDDVIGEVLLIGDGEGAGDFAGVGGEGGVVGDEVEALGVGDDAVEIENDAALAHGGDFNRWGGIFALHERYERE